MIELRTLGGLHLRGPPGRDYSAVLAQPKRLALLAFLALAHRAGYARRDTIVGLFWPELDDEHARSALRQTLTFLRRALGNEVLVSRGTAEIAVNEAALHCDAAAFDRACDAGDLGTAFELYQGDLLEGLFVTDAAPDLEHWIENQRARLRQRARQAASRLVSRSENQGNVDLAAEHARRALTLFPQDEAGLRRLMALLEQLGDYDGALRAYEGFSRQLAAEYEVEPAGETTALMMRVRSHIGGAALSRDGARVAGAARERFGAADPLRRDEQAARRSANELSETADDSIRASEEERGETAVLPTHPTAPTARGGARRTVALVGGALSVAALVLVAATSARRGGAGPTRAASPDPSRIVVLPFRVTSSDSSLDYLREGMIDLLATKFTGEGGPRAIESRTSVSASRRILPADGAADAEDAARVARAVGAGLVLLGELVQTSATRLQLTASAFALSDGGIVARASVDGAADSLPALVERLAARLLAQHAGEREPRLSALTDSVPLPALRAFLEGRAAQRRGADQAAVSSLSRALRLDSTFTVAAVEIVASMGWLFRWTVRQDSVAAGGVRLGSGLRVTGDQALWSRAMDVAWRGRGRLSERDLAYLVALRGEHYPRASTAREVLADWERAVRAAPDRPEAWNRLGYVLLQQGLALGLSDSRTRAAALFHRALALDSAYASPLAGLLEIAASARDTAQVRRLGTLYLARDSSGEHADYVRWRVASVIADRAALSALRGRMDSFDTQTLDRIQWTSQTDGIALDDAMRAMTVVVRRAGERKERWISLWLANILALNSGRPRESLALTESKLQVEPDSGLFQWYRVLHALYWDADSAAGADAARRLELHARAALVTGRGYPPPRDPYRVLALVEQWKLSHGDTSTVERTVQLLRRSAAAGDPAASRRAEFADLIDAMRSTVAARPGVTVLLERLDSVALRGCCDTPHYLDLAIARVRERTGDVAGALRTVRRGRWLYPPEYLSTYLREEGHLAALTGDREGAIRAYRHYLALRLNPEPPLRREVERIRAEVARLERGR